MAVVGCRQRTGIERGIMRTFHGFWVERTVLLAIAGVLGGRVAAAQQPQGNAVQVQREAMQKLAFLAGRWSGPVRIVRGPGEPLRLTQTEHVEFKLDGLVLLIEGQSAAADGKPQFAALATIAYDDETRAYRIRAYNGGHYLDSELTVLADGFWWGFQGGPAHIVNTMHLTATGEWQEATEVTMGDNPPHMGVEMMLKKQGN
jgi:hypothetical protein